MIPTEMSTERKWRVVGNGQEDDPYFLVSGVNHERKRIYQNASQKEGKHQTHLGFRLPIN